jgi:hypothetical protein
LHIATNRRRRATITVLGETPTIGLREMVDVVCKMESVSVIGTDERKAVRVALYQSHLPKLEGHGIVEWSGRSGDPISRGPEFDALHALVRDVRTRFPEDTGELKAFEGTNSVELPTQDQSYQDALNEAGRDADD